MDLPTFEWILRVVADKSGPDSCWEWPLVRNSAGYGVVKVGGFGSMAHRIAVAVEEGPIRRGQVVMHSCDNPPCCNPTHLRVGTQSENRRDMLAKGRDPYSTRTTCRKGHPMRGRGWCPACKEMSKERAREAAKRKYHADPDKFNRRAVEWMKKDRAAHPEKYRERDRRRHERDRMKRSTLQRKG